MTDAPERVFYQPRFVDAFVETIPQGRKHIPAVEYLRADIAAAQINRLQDELLDLQSRRVSVVRDYMKREAEQRERAAARIAALEADLARARERVEAQGWQPIETAPMDGTKIDLWMTDQDGKGWREANAYYVRERPVESTVYAPDGRSIYTCIRRDGWFAPGHDYEGADGFCDEPRHFNDQPRQNRWFWREPTHWMPTPSAP